MKLVPEAVRDVLPSAKRLLDLNVTYGSLAAPVTDGMTITKRDAAHAPDVDIIGAHPSKHYSLVMVDPDAPSPDDPTMAQWLHWIVVNIPGAKPASAGRTLMQYAGPTPPKGTHRYIFYAFEQPEAEIMQFDTIPERHHFNVQQWSEGWGLGPAVAVRYFVSHP